jgi:hypothetical protein
MPIRAENSIDCDCGGRYTPKNKSKHMKTKKHRDYEEQEQYTQPCSNGCGTILAENVGIYLLSKEGEEDEQWCSECFQDCGLEARAEGWTADEDGEQLLDEMEAEKNKINCLHCGEDTFEGVECEHCGENYNQEHCYRKGCDICDDTCIHCNERSEFDKDTTECLNCGMYQDIERAEEEEKIEYLCRHCEDTTTDPDECDNCGYSPELGNCPDKECEMCYGDEDK